MRNREEGFSRKKRVGIIGSGSPDEASLRIAEETGKRIAENGYILVNGGMYGVMEASARGARSAGGLVIGILPGTSSGEGNSYTDIPIYTGLGHLRNAMVVMNSDVLIAIDGSYGTLSEIAFAKIYHRYVFGLNTWNIEGVIPLNSPEEALIRINRLFNGQ